MRKSSSTSLRDSPWVSTLPQMAPILGVWAASQGRRGLPFRQRSAAARRPRRPRLARCAGTACVRPRPDALCQFVGAGAPALPSPARNLRAVPLREPSVPRPGRDRRSTWGVESLASFALGISLCSRWDAAPELPFATRRTNQSGGGRPSLRTQTVPSLGAARRAWRGCHHWPQSPAHPCAAATACRRRCAAHVTRRSRQARSVRTPSRSTSRQTPRPPPTQ